MFEKKPKFLDLEDLANIAREELRRSREGISGNDVNETSSVGVRESISNTDPASYVEEEQSPVEEVEFEYPETEEEELVPEPVGVIDSEPTLEWETEPKPDPVIKVKKEKPKPKPEPKRTRRYREAYKGMDIPWLGDV